MDAKQLDEFRICFQSLCEMAALYAVGDPRDIEECKKYVRTCSEFLEMMEASMQVREAICDFFQESSGIIRDTIAKIDKER